MTLEVDNIHCFYGQSHVLLGVSLAVRQGEIVSLLGRNGAGKTTTIMSIAGLLCPRSGDIRLSGRSIKGLRAYEICRLGVGWVPQGRRLFPEQSVLENLQLATLKLDTREQAQQIGKACELFPRLAERRDTRAGNLSGGEQQMLAIARALIGSPRLLILDEPTEGLSPLVVNDILRVVKDYAANGAAVLLAEQNIRAALLVADRHYVLGHGKVQLTGTTAELHKRQDDLSEHLGVKAKSHLHLNP